MIFFFCSFDYFSTYAIYFRHRLNFGNSTDGCITLLGWMFNSELSLGITSLCRKLHTLQLSML